jgi:hypothetical protein|tara:strand:+ start:461 stop:1144 length:684 start_codon:yes stop_codon:yes gene_type:complete
MATSGTATFNPEIVEIVEEAYERCGLELRSGYDLKTARRSLDIMAAEWSNKGINLWTVEAGTVALTTGTATYTLPADTIDLLETVIRTGSGSNQQDLSINRISVSTYATIPNKNNQGRPIQIYVDRQATPKVNVWPTPDSSTTYTLAYWRLRRIEDAGRAGSNTYDVPSRFIPCLVAGLAYHIATKRPEVGLDRVTFLKAAYDEQFTLAADEDRDKSSIQFAPNITS